MFNGQISESRDNKWLNRPSPHLNFFSEQDNKLLLSQ